MISGLYKIDSDMKTKNIILGRKDIVDFTANIKLQSKQSGKKINTLSSKS